MVAKMRLSNKWRGSRHVPDGIRYKTDWVSYLFELAYDLLLCPKDCVSAGPGFEGPLGWYVNDI